MILFRSIPALSAKRARLKRYVRNFGNRIAIARIGLHGFGNTLFVHQDYREYLNPSPETERDGIILERGNIIADIGARIDCRTHDGGLAGIYRDRHR